MSRSSARKEIVAITLCFGVAFASAEPNLFAQATPASAGDQFRVDMEYVQDGERVTVRRFVSGTRSRMETAFDGQTFINIQLGDAAGTMYVLMPDQKRAMKISLAAMQGTTTSGTGAGRAVSGAEGL